jgi:hypothetical protein
VKIPALSWRFRHVSVARALTTAGRNGTCQKAPQLASGMQRPREPEPRTY